MEQKNISVKVDLDIHSKVKSEQEEMEITMSQYFTMLLEKHFSTDSENDEPEQLNIMELLLEDGMVDSELQSKVNAELEEQAITTNQFVTIALEAYFKRKGGSEMARTMAFQVDEELFQRIKDHIARTGITQKAFIVGLVEAALDQAEAQLSQESGLPSKSECDEPQGAQCAPNTEGEEDTSSDTEASGENVRESEEETQSLDENAYQSDDTYDESLDDE